jgi:hypothetical protein
MSKKYNTCIDVSSSQTFRSYLHILYSYMELIGHILWTVTVYMHMYKYLLLVQAMFVNQTHL